MKTKSNNSWTLKILKPGEKPTTGYLIVDACTCEFPNYGNCNWCQKKEYFKIK